MMTTGEPIPDPIGLDAKIAWMRSRGITSLALPDGTRIDLGPEPVKTPEPPPAVSPAQALAERRRQAERDEIRDEILMYAGSEGLPDDIEAEIDRVLLEMAEPVDLGGAETLERGLVK